MYCLVFLGLSWLCRKFNALPKILEYLATAYGRLVRAKTVKLHLGITQVENIDSTGVSLKRSLNLAFVASISHYVEDFPFLFWIEGILFVIHILLTSAN